MYRKPTHYGFYTHWTSFIPHHQKRNLEFRLLDRAYKIASTYNAIHNEFMKIKSMLIKKRIPKSIPWSLHHEISQQETRSSSYFFHLKTANGNHDQHGSPPMADPGGQFGAIVPANGCGAALKWRPFDQNAPLFGAYRGRNKGKYTQSKLNNALHFVELQYVRDGLWPSLLRIRINIAIVS